MIPINQADMTYITKSVLVVFVVLGLFLTTKVVTEIVSWSKDTEYPTRTFSVSAEAEVLAVADIASFSFGVNEEGETSEEAQAIATEKINKAIEYLKSAGVDEKDIKTESYSIYPKYSMVAPCRAFDCPPATSQIVGYQVSQNVRVKVRDIDNTGKFLTELAGFGITNVSGISFTIDDEEVLYDEARTEAIKKAQVKAEDLARELGIKVGKMVSFNEESPRSPSYYQEGYGGDMMKSSISPEIPVGENTYTTRVHITYEMK